MQTIGYDAVYGARPLKRFMVRRVETPVARLIISGEVSEGSRIIMDPENRTENRGEVKSKTMAQRRNFSSEFKAKVVLEVLREEETVSQIAAKHKIHHSILRQWKKTVTEGLPSLFADPRKKSAEEIDRESTISDLYKQVGLLSMQLEWLKKKCGIDSFTS
jgi:transposase-like protein